MNKKVLNVGGNNKTIPIPTYYNGWTHHLLDIDPKGNPDIVCDVRNLSQITAAEYDSVYCSHNLEHYYSHDVFKVVSGFHHILKPEGFVHARVPDILALMQKVVAENLDIEDVLYQSPAGPIRVKDIIYGLGKEIEESHCDFFAHKTGFSVKSLRSIFIKCGFPYRYFSTSQLEIRLFAFKQPPNKEMLQLLNLPTN